MYTIKFHQIINGVILLSFITSSAIAKDTTTINSVDEFGKKQGIWVFTNKMLNGNCGDENQKVEEGKYVNSRKDGLWKTYYCDQVIKSKITYTNNRPNGYAIVYHPNGKIKEEGEWKNNRWVGAYKLYYPNGQLKNSFNFNELGKREGRQEYYHANGELQIVGNWADGKESGQLKEYYANGDLRSIKTFNGGAIDASKTQTFETKRQLPKTETIEEEITPPPAPVVVAKVEKVNMGRMFDGEGYWQLYNANQQVTKDGTFKKNRLINGKSYHYDDDGLLVRIAIYKGGKYVGDGVIEEETSASR